jgi:hypothetical protein
MKLSEHKDLKASIINLPPKEKDKLLLRLIAKDKVLTEHLHFKLLEDELDLEDRKNRIKSDIDDSIPEIKKLNAKDALARFRLYQPHLEGKFLVIEILGFYLRIFI